MVSGLSTHKRACCSHHHHLQPAPTRAPETETPTAPVQGEDRVFSYNPQDRRVMAPGTKVISNVVQGARGPETDKAMLNEGLDPVDGKYVYGPGDPRQNTAVAFSSVAHTIEVFREAFGEFGWSFPYEKLAVHANAGKDFNAFYSRRQGTVNFFQEEDPVYGQPVHSGASGEIVAHEVGHAILDGIRPEYFAAWRTDPGAFHEAFGDMLAMHVSLMDERVIRRVVVQTSGDLSKPNIAAHMAEELAQGLNNRKGSNATGGDFLRNAINNFRWAEPKSLPEKGGPDQLGWEIHSFSRLWTAAHYDLLKSLVSERLQAGEKPDVALRDSNRELLQMLAHMIREAPRGDFTFRDMAIAFVRSDKIHNGGKRAELIENVFKAREILPQDLAPEMLEVPISPARLFASEEAPFTPVRMTLGGDFGMFSGAEVEVPVATERALFKSDEIRQETQDDIRRLIAAGKIRYNDPNYQMKFPQDYFNPQGDLYLGSVTWVDGKMKIERLAVAH